MMMRDLWSTDSRSMLYAARYRALMDELQVVHARSLAALLERIDSAGIEGFNARIGEIEEQLREYRALMHFDRTREAQRRLR